MVKIIDNSTETDYVKTEDISLDKLAEINTKMFDGVKYYRKADSRTMEGIYNHVKDFWLDPEKCIISIAKDEVTKRNPDGKRYVLYSTEHESFEKFVSKMD